MYIKQNKIVQLEPCRNIELYYIQLKFPHTPVQVDGLVWVEKLHTTLLQGVRVRVKSKNDLFR